MKNIGNHHHPVFCWVSHQPPVKYPPIFNGSSNLCTTTSPSGISTRSILWKIPMLLSLAQRGLRGVPHVTYLATSAQSSSQSTYLWCDFVLTSKLSDFHPKFFYHWQYPPVNMAGWKIPHFLIVGNTSSKGPFSLAMLVYPSVSYMKVIIWAQKPLLGVKWPQGKPFIRPLGNFHHPWDMVRAPHPTGISPPLPRWSCNEGKGCTVDVWEIRKEPSCWGW